MLRNKQDTATKSDKYQRHKEYKYVTNEGGDGDDEKFGTTVADSEVTASGSATYKQRSLLRFSLFRKVGHAIEKEFHKGSIEDWTKYFEDKDCKLIAQYSAPILNNELVYSACSDLVLNLSPEEFYQKRTDPYFRRKNPNFGFIYFDNRKQLLCTDLETNEPKVIYEAEEDIHSFQIRDDGTIFLCYWTNTIDIIRPTEDGVYERIQEIDTKTVRNYQLYLSDADQNTLYLRAVIEEIEQSDGELSGQEEQMHGGLMAQKIIYKEGIRKMKFEERDQANRPFQIVEFSEYLVESNQKKQLQNFVFHEELETGFVYDTSQKCISLINLENMTQNEKVPIINSGEITNMFIDFNSDKLYYQQGNFHDTLQVEFQTFKISDLEQLAPRTFEEYHIKQHISTVKLGSLIVIGMLDKVAFLDQRNGVLLGEYKCTGRVDSIRMSNDEKELYIYTDKCKFYKIQRNQTKHFMHWVPSSKEVRCFLPIYDKDDPTHLDKILMANHKKFKFILADAYETQYDNLELNGQSVFNMELLENGDQIYAIMSDQDGSSIKAYLYLIDLNEQQIIRRYDTPLRKDSKIVLHNDKAIILEPFRTKKIYVVDGENMIEVNEDDLDETEHYVQLDGIEKSDKWNVLMVMIEKRVDQNLMKFIRLLDLDELTSDSPTQKKLREDVQMNGQTQPKVIRICPQERYVAISHSSGKIELWMMETLVNRQNPLPYRIYKNQGDSDFVFYYAGSFPRLVSLKSKRSDNYKNDGEMHTILIIQEVEKQEPNLKQIIDINAKEINLDYDQNIMFVRDHRQQLYHLDMDNFQKQSTKEMNYFRTELMRQYIHYYQKMSEERKATILKEIPFNTHFNWNFNLVSVMACMGQKNDPIKGLFKHGVPYISELNGDTPLKHAVDMHDQDVINVIMSQLNNDVNQLPVFDVKYMIQNFTSSWKKNFMFQPTQFTMGAYEKVKGVFQGKVKDNKMIAFTESKYVGLKVLDDCVDFEDEEDQATLVAETFKVQLNFNFDTKLCFELFDIMLSTNNEFFEQTQIDCIIDYIFEQNKIKFVIQNLLYVCQAANVSLWLFFPEKILFQQLMYTFAGIIMFIEFIQIQNDPVWYLTSPFNYLDIVSQIMVIVILKYPSMKHFTWLMILLIMLKAVLTLRISQAQRTLIQMIIECIKGMIPFLIVVAASVFSFALVTYSLDKEDDVKERGLFINLGNQYKILFGENTEIDFESKFTIRWFLYVSFTILMCVVMLNLLISIISDDYDRVQATQKSTDIKSKIDILYDFGVLQRFFYKIFLCRFQKKGDPLYVHRFILASEAGTESGDQWMGRVKMLTEKQETLLAEVKEVKAQLAEQDLFIDKRFDQMEQMIKDGILAS